MKKFGLYMMWMGATMFFAGFSIYVVYDEHKEQEFIVAKDVNYVGKQSVNIEEAASKLGKGPRTEGHHAYFKASKAGLKKLDVPAGVIVEPVIMYSKDAWGCARDPEPLPVPTPNPNQPSQVVDWGVVATNALDTSEDGSSVTVCVLDTGIDKSHPDLRYKKGNNFTTSNKDDFQDRDGHGSHTAGLVAAVNNNIGVVGASQAQLIIGKVLSDDGYGQNNWIADGIYWCADNGADIISMSLGGPTPSSIIKNALQYALNKGLWVFAAAGNDGSSEVGYPAGYVMQNLFSIAATDHFDRLAYFSNYGKVEFSCPGVDIYSTVAGGYGTMSGTSMATPICAGVGALYRARKVPLKARPLGDAYHFGAGMLDPTLSF